MGIILYFVLSFITAAGTASVVDVAVHNPAQKFDVWEQAFLASFAFMGCLGILGFRLIDAIKGAHPELWNGALFPSRHKHTV